MDNLECIREIFSKASMVFDQHRIVAFYADDELIEQSFDGDGLGLLSGLIDTASWVSFDIKKGKHAAISFGIDTGVFETVFYPPLDRAVQFKDIEAASDIVSDEPGSITKEFLESVDPNREVDIGFLRDLVDYVYSKNPAFENLEGFSKWKSFKGISDVFAGLSRASDVLVMPYSARFPGCVEFDYFHERTPVKYSNDDKRAFADMIKASSEVDFTIDAYDGGVIEMTVFA